MPGKTTPGSKTNGSRFVKLFYNTDGSPVRRVKPKERMSKKERRRKRREEKEG
jgi:hypothetical protein